jgi:hypothetical protein
MNSAFIEMFRGFDGADLCRVIAALMAAAVWLDWKFGRKK